MSALGGSACSVLWHPGQVSAGASGALFGVAGALLVFFVAHRHSITELLFRPGVGNLIVLLALEPLLRAMVPAVDNMAAHRRSP